MVGQALAGRLAELGHNATVGTREPAATLARSEPLDTWGTPAFGVWRADHADVKLASFAEAAATADLVINATSGEATLTALEAAGAANLDGKVILDVANPLDFSNGFPPSLYVSGTDSLGEQIQRAYPAAKVVKSLNTINCLVMVDPKRVPGDLLAFVSGDDAQAKATVEGMLAEFGWKADRIVDLGGIETARSSEMLCPMWLTLMQKFDSGRLDDRRVARRGGPTTEDRATTPTADGAGHSYQGGTV
jgi:8-hydroxy-5-deazaflavin:NADPH oxidoreductase